MHKFYEGKVQIMPKCAITRLGDFAIWYTPGVAALCKIIQADQEKSFEPHSSLLCHKFDEQKNLTIKKRDSLLAN